MNALVLRVIALLEKIPHSLIAFIARFPSLRCSGNPGKPRSKDWPSI